MSDAKLQKEAQDAAYARMGKLTDSPTPEKKGGKGAAVEAADGLAELVPAALKALRESLAGGGRARYGSTRSADARYVLDVVLERLPEAGSGEGEKPAVVKQLTPEAAVHELRKRLSGGNGG